MSPQRGRPKQNDIDALFTKVWFNGVKVSSRLTSCYAIARELEMEQPAGRKGRSARPRNIKPYEKGLRAVAKDIVTRAEHRFPGTARYFHSPIRSLLRGAAVDEAWIEHRLELLPVHIATIVLQPLIDPLTLKPVSMLKPFDDERTMQLAAAGDIHAMEAAVLLMKPGEIHSLPELRRLAREAYIRLQPNVRADPVIAPIADDLFHHIDRVFPLWLYTRPDFRCVALFNPLSQCSSPRSPEQILADERSPRTQLQLARIEIERRILASRSLETTVKLRGE